MPGEITVLFNRGVESKFGAEVSMPVATPSQQNGLLVSLQNIQVTFSGFVVKDADAESITLMHTGNSCDVVTHQVTRSFIIEDKTIGNTLKPEQSGEAIMQTHYFNGVPLVTPKKHQLGIVVRSVPSYIYHVMHHNLKFSA